MKNWQVKELEKIDGWDIFVEIELSSTDKKKQLIEMAKNGEPRPKQGKHPLSNSLNEYTTRSKSKHHGYDLEFDETIRKIAPHWFPSILIKIHKQQLLEMAKNNEPRPQKRKHFLGGSLVSYTCKAHASYDAKFDAKIRELAPHWFMDTAAKNKKQLIEMAKNGEPRPKRDYHPLASYLGSYTNISQGSYDAIFVKQLKEVAPHWFATQRVVVARNKEQLIEMAKNGEPRPIWGKHPLGELLCNYIGKKSYDAEFDKKIRELAPHWLINTAVENKKQLIEMAKNGESRPIRGRHLLARYLVSYTSKKESSYNVEFDKKIRELAPHWFKK